MAYGLKYTLTFDDVHKTPAEWRVEFYFQDYTGDSTELTGSGTPLVITRGEQGQDKMVPIVGSQAEIEIVITDSKFDPSQFFVIQQFQIKVVILKDEVTWWDGYVKPDYCQYPYASIPYPFKIVATDGIALLKNNLVDLTDEKRDTGYVSILKLLMEKGLFLTQHGNDALRVMSSLKRTGEDKTLAGLSTRYELWVDDKDAFMNIYDILVQIATSFTARIFFDQGYVYFQRIADLVNPDPTIWQYSDSDAEPSQITLPDSFFKVLKGELSSSEMIYQNNDAYITIMSPYKQSLIDIDYKFRTWLQNGDWHDWDGSDFANWNKNIGDLNIDQHGAGTKDDPYTLFYNRRDGGDGILWQAVDGILQGWQFKIEFKVKFLNCTRTGIRLYICDKATGSQSQFANELKRLVLFPDGHWGNAQDNLGSAGNIFVTRNGDDQDASFSISSNAGWWLTTGSYPSAPSDEFVLLLYILDPGGDHSDDSEYHGVEISEIKLSVITNGYTGETYTNRSGKDFSKYNEVENFSLIDKQTVNVANVLHYDSEGLTYWTSDDIPAAIENFQALSLYSTMNINSFPFEIMEGTFYSNKVKFFNTIQRAFGEFKLFMQLYDQYNVKMCEHKMTLAEIREVTGIQTGTTSNRKFKTE